MIVRIGEKNEKYLACAAEIHAQSWRSSHCTFCSESFVRQHTAERQKAYLEAEIRSGKQLYMLIKDVPVGIVSVKDGLIENLYVLPAEQRKGYGTELLLFAMESCGGDARLWVLDRNQEAQSLYRKHGFRMTGKRHSLSAQLSELEMERKGK